jgi:hypothetical protein
MPLPTTTLALFDILAADTVLTPLMGIHTLAAGGTRKALAHFFPKETLEPTTSPSGVEIIVWRSPLGTSAQPAQTGEVYQNPMFRLTVTQWEPASPTGAYNIQAVLNRLQILLPGSNVADVTIDGLTTGLSQHVLTWTCPVAVLKP